MRAPRRLRRLLAEVALGVVDAVEMVVLPALAVVAALALFVWLVS